MVFEAVRNALLEHTSDNLVARESDARHTAERHLPQCPVVFVMVDAPAVPVRLAPAHG